MSCACCKGRSKVVTIEDRPGIHGHLTVTARYYWLQDTGWYWCSEQVTRVILHVYGENIDITHMLDKGKDGHFDLIDTDLWADVESALEHGRYGLEEPNLKQEMTEEEFMMEAMQNGIR